MKKNNRTGLIILLIIFGLLGRSFWFLLFIAGVIFLIYVFDKEKANASVEEVLDKIKQVSATNNEANESRLVTRNPVIRSKLTTFQKMELDELQNRLKMNDLSIEEYHQLREKVLGEMDSLLD